MYSTIKRAWYRPLNVCITQPRRFVSNARNDSNLVSSFCTTLGNDPSAEFAIVGLAEKSGLSKRARQSILHSLRDVRDPFNRKVLVSMLSRSVPYHELKLQYHFAFLNSTGNLQRLEVAFLYGKALKRPLRDNEVKFLKLLAKRLAMNRFSSESAEILASIENHVTASDSLLYNIVLTSCLSCKDAAGLNTLLKFFGTRYLSTLSHFQWESIGMIALESGYENIFNAIRFANKTRILKSTVLNDYENLGTVSSISDVINTAKDLCGTHDIRKLSSVLQNSLEIAREFSFLEEDLDRIDSVSPESRQIIGDLILCLLQMSPEVDNLSVLISYRQLITHGFEPTELTLETLLKVCLALSNSKMLSKAIVDEISHYGITPTRISMLAVVPIHLRGTSYKTLFYFLDVMRTHRIPLRDYTHRRIRNAFDELKDPSYMRYISNPSSQYAKELLSLAVIDDTYQNSAVPPSSRYYGYDYSKDKLYTDVFRSGTKSK